MATNFKVEESYTGPFVKMSEILTDGNVRPMDEKHIKELAASIKKSGLIERPTLQKVADGQYQIVSGFHRIAALRQLKWESVPVQFVGERVGSFASVTANIMRLDMPAMEIARNFVAICTEDDQISADKVKALAGELGRSESFVKGYIRLKTDLVGEFQDLLANPKSGFTKEHGLAVAAASEKAKQAEVYALWKHAPGQSADTVKVWAKNPQKAAESMGIKPQETKSKAAVGTKAAGEKPYHAGSEYQKEVARLVKGGYDAELVNDTAKALMPLIETICAKVTAEGLDFDALIQKLTEAMA